MKIENIIIRKAKAGDEKEIAQVRDIGLKEKNWIYTGGNTPSNNKKIIKLRKQLSKKNSDTIIFIAIDKTKNKIIGSSSAWFKQTGRLRHRVDMGWGLLPDYQGKGIGTKLLKETLNYCKSKGFKRAESEMAIKNKASWKLALKCRFKIEGTKKKALLTDDNRYIDTYIVGKELK